MKRFTLFIVAALIATISFAQKPVPAGKALVTPTTTANQFVETPQKADIKAFMTNASTKNAKKRAPKKAVASAADLEGSYVWNYLSSSDLAEDPSTLSNTSSNTANVTITVDNEGTLTISGMFPNDLTASYDEGSQAIVIESQLAGTSSYGDYAIKGLFYYGGDDQYGAGWYYTTIYGYILEDGTIYFEDWMIRVLQGGQYDGYSLTPYYVAGSKLEPSEPIEAVTLPDNVELIEYSLSATDNSGNPYSGTAYIGIDGNDVYLKGYSSYIPDALIKGTKDGNTVTFAANQYLGSYYGYDSYFIKEAVFTYDEATDTYTADGDVYSLLGNQYIDVYTTDPILRGVKEKAAMPANPAITGLRNSKYGYIIDFNVPNVDTNGEGLVSSKLFYEFFTDVEGEVNPMTFTPTTHSRITENMTIIPFGFSEDYDFYNTYVYLNDLYSSDWNKIGIKSIYYGGGETNETEIQWFDVKPYAITVTAKSADNKTFYTTFFNATTSYVADANTKVYTAKVSDSGEWVDLAEVTNKTIPAGNAVILESDAENIKLGGSTTTGTLSNNDLKGAAADKAPAEGVTTYVLANGDAGVGFYQFAGATLAAGKAYIEIAGDAAAKVLTFGETTAINGVADVKAGNAVIYNLAGQRVNNALKGVFIQNGKKVVF